LSSTPSSRKSVCSLLAPRIETDEDAPGPPLRTAERPRTASSASRTKVLPVLASSSPLTTVTELPTFLSGVSIRVAVTTRSCLRGSAAWA
jgi:hypothetical protein